MTNVRRMLRLDWPTPRYPNSGLSDAEYNALEDELTHEGWAGRMVHDDTPRHNHFDDRDQPADPMDCPACAEAVRWAGG